MESKPEKNNLQDVFLLILKNEESNVVIYLINGVKLEGVVVAFDNFCLCLQRHDRQQLVYKHAISTILPTSPMKLF